MQDDFADFTRSLTSPAEEAIAVTPSDATDLPQVCRGLYVGSGGDASVVMASGDVVTFTGLMGGVIYPLRVSRVRSSGTSAGGIVALY